MLRFSVFVIVATMTLLASNANAVEIRQITDQAKEWEAISPDNKLVGMKESSDTKHLAELKAKGFSISNENGAMVLRVQWSHEGQSSKSTHDRNYMAANVLFSKADEFIKEWNKKFGVEKQTFGGVLFSGIEGSQSSTKAPPFQPRSYNAQGIAVGIILVAP